MSAIELKQVEKLYGSVRIPLLRCYLAAENDVGKPTKDAYIERFNRTVRHEWLDLHMFESVEHAQKLATEWLWIYNNERPNTAIGGIPPKYLTQVVH